MECMSQAWWCMALIPALRRQKHKVVCECQTIQSYIEKPYREKKKEYTIL